MKDRNYLVHYAGNGLIIGAIIGAIVGGVYGYNFASRENQAYWEMFSIFGAMIVGFVSVIIGMIYGYIVTK